MAENPTRKTVIVGGVAGGASCAARLRRLDEGAEIVMLERGAYISYANCGLPYTLSEVIPSGNALLLVSPEAMKRKYRVDARVKSEVLAIDRAEKRVLVKNLETGETYRERYDTLVLATGSSPVRPKLPGIDSPRVMTLWTVPDANAIRERIQKLNAKRVLVIGGGFIGLEMAENLRLAGLFVSLVVIQNQVLPPLDGEMARLVQQTLLANGIDVRLGDGVAFFEDDGTRIVAKLSSGETVCADLVMLAIGVKPNGEVAKAAGLTVNARGGIVTDAYLRTSDPDIYAVGDVIEVADFTFQDAAMIPLAGPANKQGRIAADNIAGANEMYRGTQGTSIVKVFDLAAASTGANEKALNRRGLRKGIDYETVLIAQNSHADYYPGATPLFIKLLFSMDGRTIYGAQIVGREGVDKRIDTLSVAMRMKCGVQDLKELECAYAPPFSSAKDPVNMAGFVAENALRGLVRFAPWDVLETGANPTVLDVREDHEVKAFAIPGAVHIPMGQLRNRLCELEPSANIVVFCAIGVRGYNAARILAQNGFKNVWVYPGGVKFYCAAHLRGAPAQNPAQHCLSCDRISEIARS